jgi:hypothetical protein
MVNARFAERERLPERGRRGDAGSLERLSASDWRLDGDDEATDAAFERDFSAEV